MRCNSLIERSDLYPGFMSYLFLCQDTKDSQAEPVFNVYLRTEVEKTEQSDSNLFIFINNKVSHETLFVEKPV